MMGTWSIGEVVDYILLEQFLNDLGGNTQCWVRCHQPKTMEEALRLAGDYVTAEIEGKAPKREQSSGIGIGQCLETTSKGRKEEVLRQPGQEPRGWDNRDFVCYR